ncbi:MAG: hypothetical protein D6715_00585 [Calditrichaeota bacterium]|nr:MAG: hypothetical protein D6715_00585 [Calditrichota bacterium]
MSLRAIHIFFISLAMALLVGFGLWSWTNYARLHAGQYLAYVVLCVVSIVALAVYLVKFIQKTRSM